MNINLLLFYTYHNKFNRNWYLEFRLEPLIDVNFNGIQNNDTGNRHDQGRNVCLSNVLEDQDIRLKFSKKEELDQGI